MYVHLRARHRACVPAASAQYASGEGAQLPCWLHTPGEISTFGPSENTQSATLSGHVIAPIPGTEHEAPTFGRQRAALGSVPGGQTPHEPFVPAVPAAHGWHSSRLSAPPEAPQPMQTATTISNPSSQPRMVWARTVSSGRIAAGRIAKTSDHMTVRLPRLSVLLAQSSTRA
jgi:hypothetical protein